MAIASSPAERSVLSAGTPPVLGRPFGEAVGDVEACGVGDGDATAVKDQINPCSSPPFQAVKKTGVE
jgi:hypothetical protein